MMRIDSFLLAGVGVLVAHQGAYTLSAMTGQQSSLAHGHMQTAWLLGSLAVLALLTRSVVSSLRRRATSPVSEIALFVWIALGYSGLELGERVVDGYGALTLFSEPVYWIGLSLAPLVALALGWSFRSLEEAVSAFVAVAPDLVIGAAEAATCSSVFNYPEANALGRLLVLAAPRRGPPFVS